MGTACEEERVMGIHCSCGGGGDGHHQGRSQEFVFEGVKKKLKDVSKCKNKTL
jgi:hypothetical protein